MFVLGNCRLIEYFLENMHNIRNLVDKLHVIIKLASVHLGSYRDRYMDEPNGFGFGIHKKHTRDSSKEKF